jgi:phospholipid/cholesterol/gamma-HCH transport system ATP-binding protein
MEQGKPIISVRDIHVQFGRHVVLHDLDLDVYRGEILGFVGASGTGKSVLLRTILGLNKKQGGSIVVLGRDLDKISEEERIQVDMRMGVLFQHGALFSALTVKENIQVPMREYLSLPKTLDGRTGDAEDRTGRACPQRSGQISVGAFGRHDQARGAGAGALALDPDIVFLDEPTSGLDPVGAAEFDELIAKLRDTLGLTVYMVTHDLDSLFTVADRIAVLGDKRVLIEGTIGDMLQSEDPWVKSYFRGKRARRIETIEQEPARAGV